jgi:hypothetical protein
MNSSKVPIFDEAGKVVGTVGITRNVDKMVRVEHRIKAERDLLQLLIDNIPSLYLFQGCSIEIYQGKSCSSKLLGASSIEDVIGKTDFDFYPEENAVSFYTDEMRIVENDVAIVNKIEEVYPPAME